MTGVYDDGSMKLRTNCAGVGRGKSNFLKKKHTALALGGTALWDDGERWLGGGGETKAELGKDKQMFLKGRPVPMDKE